MHHAARPAARSLLAPCMVLACVLPQAGPAAPPTEGAASPAQEPGNLEQSIGDRELIDHNRNGIDDAQDIATGRATDDSQNGIIDDAEN